MKKLFEFLKRKYFFGLNLYFSPEIKNELVAQPFYIQALVCGLRILYEIDSKKILGYILFTILHLLSMYELGYLCLIWKENCKGKIYTNTYRTINIVLLFGSFLAKIPGYFLLIVCATICGFASLVLMKKIQDFEDTIVILKNKYAHLLIVRILGKIPYNPATIINILAMFLAIIAINTLPINILYRFIISVIYGLFIPFIVAMANDGMNFYEALF